MIFGGLISATLLDAVVTPLLFLKVGQRALDHLAMFRGQLSEQENF